MDDPANPRWNLIDSFASTPMIAMDDSGAHIQAHEPQLPHRVSAGTGRFVMDWKRLEGGKQANVELLTIDTGAVTAAIVPTRGMGLWKCWANEIEFGWTSPVRGPVHPSFVPIYDPSGIGWLEGFDEMFVRCGMQSNGAPEFDAAGRLCYPLHGRVANLPAQKLHIEIDVDNGVLDVVGVVCETRFHRYSLELQARYRFRAGSPVIEITDTVTNRLGTPTGMQMLYHINIGQPVLQSGSIAHVPAKSVSPRNQRSAAGIDTWHRYAGPETGFEEQVYLIDPRSDENRWSEAMICSVDESTGFAVHFDTRTLPYFNLWKDTGGIEDGYVTGLEPATGYPNPRSFEEQNGRVVQLQGGESRTFRLKLQPMVTAADVDHSKQRIAQLRGSESRIFREPQPRQSADAPMEPNSPTSHD